MGLLHGAERLFRKKLKRFSQSIGCPQKEFRRRTKIQELAPSIG